MKALTRRRGLQTRGYKPRDYNRPKPARIRLATLRMRDTQRARPRLRHDLLIRPRGEKPRPRERPENRDSLCPAARVGFPVGFPPGLSRTPVSCRASRRVRRCAEPLELPKLGEASTEGALHRPERRVELLRDLAKAESLQVRSLDHGSLKLGEPRQLAKKALATLVRLNTTSVGFSRECRRFHAILVQSHAIRPRRLAPKAVDQVAPGDQHDPGDELRAVRVEAVGRAPQSDEDLLNRVLGLGTRTQNLPSGLVDQDAETGVELVKGSFIRRSHALHQLPIGVFGLLHSGFLMGQSIAERCEIQTSDFNTAKSGVSSLLTESPSAAASVYDPHRTTSRFRLKRISCPRGRLKSDSDA